jgi:hypothetical protein
MRFYVFWRRDLFILFLVNQEKKNEKVKVDINFRKEFLGSGSHKIEIGD